MEYEKFQKENKDLKAENEELKRALKKKEVAFLRDCRTQYSEFLKNKFLKKSKEAGLNRLLWIRHKEFQMTSPYI